MRGTVWYLSDIIIAVTSLISTLFLLFIAALFLFIVNVHLDVDVVGHMLYGSANTQSTLLAFLDCTVEGHSMKELFAYALAQDDLTIQVDGKSIDLKEQSKQLMRSLTDKSFALKYEKDIVARHGRPERIEHNRAEYWICADGKKAKLVLILGKN